MYGAWSSADTGREDVEEEAGWLDDAAVSEGVSSVVCCVPSPSFRFLVVMAVTPLCEDDDPVDTDHLLRTNCHPHITTTTQFATPTIIGKFTTTCNHLGCNPC